jgi:two-component system, response regulator PdtaR
MLNAPAMADLAANSRHTIVVAEDEPLVRMMFADELRLAGYSVLEAADADEALCILRSGIGPRVEVVVTDLKMPGRLDGADLVRTVRNVRRLRRQATERRPR